MTRGMERKTRAGLWTSAVASPEPRRAGILPAGPERSSGITFARFDINAGTTATGSRTRFLAVKGVGASSIGAAGWRFRRMRRRCCLPKWIGTGRVFTGEMRGGKRRAPEASPGLAGQEPAHCNCLQKKQVAHGVADVEPEIPVWMAWGGGVGWEKGDRANLLCFSEYCCTMKLIFDRC